jgi:hypothetical protein
MSVLKLNQKKPTGGEGGEVTWSDVTSKPSTFPPSSHTHPQSDITNLTTDLAAKQATLVSGTNIKTINGETLLGSGNLVVTSDSGISAVAIVGANGITGASVNTLGVANVTLALGAITPTSVNSIVLSGSSTPTLAVTGTSSVSGTNTGDETTASIQTKRPLKTINSESLEGSGNIVIGGGSATQINASSGTITATAGKTMVIFGSGAYGNSNAAQTVTLNYNGSAVSSHEVRQAAATDRIGINLIAVVTTVASGAVSITTSGGALYSPKITYIIL